MRLVGLLSHIFWLLRKYFLGVQIDFDEEFLINWNEVKSFSSIDRGRNRNIYQFIKLHNNLFQGKRTNIIELGVDRGASLITMARFAKSDSTFIGIDSFAKFADEIKKESTSEIDKNYQRQYVNFNRGDRFKGFQTNTTF